jgi:hypothetical protein
MKININIQYCKPAQLRRTLLYLWGRSKFVCGHTSNFLANSSVAPINLVNLTYKFTTNYCITHYIAKIVQLTNLRALVFPLKVRLELFPSNGAQNY